MRLPGFFPTRIRSSEFDEIQCPTFLGYLSLWLVWVLVSILRWHLSSSCSMLFLLFPLLLLASCVLSQRVLVLIHLSLELSPCLSPRCCLVLHGWGWEILALMCLSHQISCRLRLGVFVTYDNHVLCRCVLLVFAGVSLAGCQRIQDLRNPCSITRFSQSSTKFGYSTRWYHM